MVPASRLCQTTDTAWASGALAPPAGWSAGNHGRERRLPPLRPRRRTPANTDPAGREPGRRPALCPD
eukprot:14462352-Alexandrium_andersonii.AAC.1